MQRLALNFLQNLTSAPFKRIAVTPSALAFLAASVCLGANDAHAQALDPTFPNVDSFVSNTAAAFLDLSTTDIDEAARIVPRNNGASMLFLALASGAQPTATVGLRRMTVNTTTTFGSNIQTGVILPSDKAPTDAVEVGAGICMVTQWFDSGPLVYTATLRCVGDNGVSTATASTPSGTAVDRSAGGLVVVGSEIVVAGSYSIDTGNFNRFYRLYLERRRASDLAVIGARVDHDITLIAPSPKTRKFLEVAKIVQDAQGRFVVAGRVSREQNSTQTEGFVARFNVDFSRDTGFGIDGVVILNFGGSGAIRFEGVPSDLAVLDNGIIAVTGLGCITTDCGTGPAAATLTRQIIVKVLRSDGSTVASTNFVTTTAGDSRLPQIEATRKPFIAGNGVGYILVRPSANGTVTVSTNQVDASGASTFVRSNNFRLQYTSNPNTVVEQSFASLATTQNAGRTRHYMAWTYKADNPNTSDTDMVMGELQGATIFADGFE